MAVSKLIRVSFKCKIKLDKNFKFHMSHGPLLSFDGTRTRPSSSSLKADALALALGIKFVSSLQIKWLLDVRDSCLQLVAQDSTDAARGRATSLTVELSTKTKTKTTLHTGHWTLGETRDSRLETHVACASLKTSLTPHVAVCVITLRPHQRGTIPTSSTFFCPTAKWPVAVFNIQM